MFSYIWPIALVVLSNVVYQICAKSTPRDIDPLASLTVTYAVGAIASAILYYATNKGGHLLREYSHLNWSPFVLGIVIVGLEVGFIYAYKAGWQVSVACAYRQQSSRDPDLYDRPVFYQSLISTCQKTAGRRSCLSAVFADLFIMPLRQST